MRIFAALLAAAALGGAAAFGIGTAVWEGGTTTVVRDGFAMNISQPQNVGGGGRLASQAGSIGTPRPGSSR